jgi:O-antigen/teichoic acid export membrane protein
MPVVVGLLIAQRWGLAELAAFTIASATMAIAMIVADWGASRALPRNLALLPAEAAADLLASANAFRLLLAGAMLLAGACAAALGHVDSTVLPYLAVLFPLCPLLIVATSGVSERVVAGETRAIGYAVAAGVAVLVVLGGATIALDLGPLALVVAYTAGKLVEAAFIVAGRWWVLSVNGLSIRETAVALWPFSSQMILGVLYSRMAVFVVERMTTREDLGVFSVGAALQSALLLIPVSIGLLHFPDMTRRARDNDVPGVRRLVVRYTITAGGAVLLGLAVLAAAAGPFSDAFEIPRHAVAFVLAFAALSLLSIISTIMAMLMQARGEEATAARLSVVTLSLAIVYQTAALFLWGLWGIVAGVAASEVTTVLVFGASLWRRSRRP